MKISKSLQETMAAHADHVHAEVHFDALGRHYFQVYPYEPVAIKDGDKIVVKPFKKGLYGYIKQNILVKPGFEDQENGKTIHQYPDESTFIVATFSRDKVLNAAAESDLLVNLADLSPEEKKAVKADKNG